MSYGTYRLTFTPRTPTNGESANDPIDLRSPHQRTQHTQLTEINDERHEIQGALDHAAQELAQARADLTATQQRVAAGQPVDPQDLLDNTRLVFEIERALADLQQQAPGKLDALDEQAMPLKFELGKLDEAQRREAFSAAVMAYQNALCKLLPLADTLIKECRRNGVNLPLHGDPSLLVRTGTHVMGSVVLEIK
ncbi:MAG: hypothetical protein ACYDBH_19465 [Acidobacteriaceae bacterium]